MKNLRIFSVMLLLASMLIGFTSCDDDDDENENESNSTYLNCDTYSIEFSSKEESKSIIIETNTTWNITKSENWINTSFTKNEDNTYTVTVSVTKNDSGKRRNGFIKFQIKDDSKTVFISQEIGHKIEIKADNLYFHIEPVLYKVKVQSTVNFDVITDVNWLYVGHSSRIDSILYFIPLPNYLTGESRTTSIMCKQKDGDVCDTLIVKQEGFFEFERNQLEKIYNNTGGANWTNNTNWCSDKPVSEWYGIKTDSNGSVIEINLSNNNLIGNFAYKCGWNIESINCNDNKLTSLDIETLPLSYSFKDIDRTGLSYEWSTTRGIKIIRCLRNNLSNIKTPNGVTVYK